MARFGVGRKGLDARNGRVLVEIDRRYFRPTEVDVLLGDPTKARTKLGWHHKVPFDALVREMVEADLAAESLKTRDGVATIDYG